MSDNRDWHSRLGGRFFHPPSHPHTFGGGTSPAAVSRHDYDRDRRDHEERRLREQEYNRRITERAEIELADEMRKEEKREVKKKQNALSKADEEIYYLLS